MTRKIVVVGAGASGLASARIAAARGAEVTVLESAEGAGGAWMPRWVEHDGARIGFDRGIRLGGSTGDARLDAIIYDDLPIEWSRVEGFCNEGHVLRGELWPLNQCPDVRRLGEAARQRVIAELIAREPVEQATTLEESLTARFGPTVVDEVHRPFLRKVLGRELNELAPGGERFFVPSRVIVADAQETERLRAQYPELDGVLAHPSTRGLRPLGRVYYHPAEGPMGQWIEGACGALRDAGVTMRFGAKVEAVEHAGDTVRAVRLASGERVHCDAVIWSRPPALLARAAGLPSSGRPPAFRDLAVCHVVASEEPLTDLSYVTFYDEDATVHRAAFHREIRPGAPAVERRALSAEVVLTGDGASDEDLTARVLHDLTASGLLPEGTTVECVTVERFHRVFPVPTRETAASDRAARETVAALSNAGVVGRSSENPFLDSILRACDREVARFVPGVVPGAVEVAA